MSRYQPYGSYGGGDALYDDRFDAGDYSAYGRVASGQYSDGTPIGHSRRARPSSSRRDVYDEYGELVEPGCSSEQDLRRVMYRYGESSSAPRTDPRDRRSDRNSGYGSTRSSRLSEQIYADDRESRRDAREQQQAQLEYQSQRDQEREYRGADRDNRLRSGRRGAVTDESDQYLAYMQAMREQQQHEYDERSTYARHSDRGDYERR